MRPAHNLPRTCNCSEFVADALGVNTMAGRNNRPKNNGPAGHPSQIDQYREEFSIDMSKQPPEHDENRKDKTRYTM